MHDHHEWCAQHPVIQEIAQKYGKIALLVIIRWGLQHGTSVLVKSSNPAHIRVCPAWPLRVRPSTAGTRSVPVMQTMSSEGQLSGCLATGGG